MTIVDVSVKQRVEEILQGYKSQHYSTVRDFLELVGTRNDDEFLFRYGFSLIDGFYHEGVFTTIYSDFCGCFIHCYVYPPGEKVSSMYLLKVEDIDMAEIKVFNDGGVEFKVYPITTTFSKEHIIRTTFSEEELYLLREWELLYPLSTFKDEIEARTHSCVLHQPTEEWVNIAIAKKRLKRYYTIESIASKVEEILRDSDSPIKSTIKEFVRAMASTIYERNKFIRDNGLVLVHEECNEDSGVITKTYENDTLSVWMGYSDDYDVFSLFYKGDEVAFIRIDTNLDYFIKVNGYTFETHKTKPLVNH